MPAAIARMEASLHTHQAGLYHDTSKLIAVHAGRRSGKTHGLVGRYVRCAYRYPGATIPLVVKTITSAGARTFWRTLKIFNDEYDLGFRFNDQLMIATAPTQAQVWMVSADKEDQIEKVRGDKYPEAWVEEAGTIRPSLLDKLIVDALEPALIDYDGVLGLSGTPEPSCRGPFARACLEEDTMWSVHHWTLLDNPYLGTPEYRRQWLANRRKLRGWTEEHPTYQQEYLGRWVRGDDRMVYRLADWNVAWDDWDRGAYPWRYGLGVDFGYDPDPAAFSVVAWRPYDPRLYAVTSYAQGYLIPSAIAAHVERHRDQYQFVFIVGDSSGKSLIEEMKQRYRIPIKGSERHSKFDAIELLNGELASGLVVIQGKDNADLIDEMKSLPKDEKGKEHPGYANHLCDAFLYAWREAGHHRAQRVLEPPKRGTPEWHAEQEAKTVTRLERALTGTPDDAGWSVVDDVEAWLGLDTDDPGW